MRRLAGIGGVSGTPGDECLGPDGLRERLHNRVEHVGVLTRAATHHSSPRKRASPQAALPQGGDAPPHADLRPRPLPGPRDRRVREPGRWARGPQGGAIQQHWQRSEHDRARHNFTGATAWDQTATRISRKRPSRGRLRDIVVGCLLREAHRRPLAASILRSRLSCGPRTWPRRRAPSIA